MTGSATSGVEVPHLASAHVGYGSYNGRNRLCSPSERLGSVSSEGKLRAAATLLCMGLFSRFLFRPVRAP